MTAHAHAFDPATGEVIDLPTKTVPLDKYRELTAERDHYKDALKEAEKDLRGKRAQITKVRQELDDFLGQAADDDEVRKFLKWWAKVTGRDGTTKLPKAKVTCATENARWYRQIRAHGYSARDACAAILGLLQSDFHRDHDLTFVKYVCSQHGKWSESQMDKHLMHGRLVLNEGETT